VRAVLRASDDEAASPEPSVDDDASGD
jgi:hypothetical protein